MRTLSSFWVEIRCPQHGLERFKIKIVRKFNMKPYIIVPKFRSRPVPGDLSCLLVGRGVSNKEIESYLVEYFRRKGWMKTILRTQLIV